LSKGMLFKTIFKHQGQVQILQAAMRDGRLAGSYLFSGPEGIGKRLTAFTLAKAVNCLKAEDDACGECASCAKIEKGAHPDVRLMESSGADAIKIESVRELQRWAGLKPYEAKKKVFIIDNAHNLTPEASNALLKILEETAHESLIILISAKPSLIFKTIISRCQRIRFSALARADLQGILKDKYSLDSSTAHYLAYLSEGRLGLALALNASETLRDKNRVIDNFVTARGDADDFTQITDKAQLRQALNILASWFRDIYLLKSGVAHNELIHLDRKSELLRVMQKYSFLQIEDILDCISDSVGYMDQNINTKIMLANLKAHTEVQ